MFDTDASDEARRLIDQLRAQHRASTVAQAAEIFALTALYRAHVACDLSVGIAHPTAGEFAATHAATALSITESAANRSIEIGLALENDLPKTKAAFAVGNIDVAQVRVIIDAIANVDPDVVAALETKLLDSAETQNSSRLRQTARRWLAANDSEGDRRRRERRVEDRDVRTRPTHDGVAFLDGLLPAAGAQALSMRLQEMARSVCADDPRTHAQRRADALVALADGTGCLQCTCGKNDCGATTSEATAARKPLIQVGVSLDTLLGFAEHPGFLHGFGAIDSDLARLLAHDGRWKLIVDAAEGAGVVKVQKPTAYRVGAELDRWIRAEDGTCRFPGCGVPAALTDIDHGEPFDHDDPAAGGQSTADNLACLCRKHHRLKTMSDNGKARWRVQHRPGRVLEWTSPTGDVHRTEPIGSTYLHPIETCVAIAVEQQPTSESFGGLVACEDPEFAERYRAGRLEPTLAEQERDFLAEIATPVRSRSVC